MDWQVTPPAWGPLPPCKQALNISYLRKLLWTHFTVHVDGLVSGLHVRVVTPLSPNSHRPTSIFSSICNAKRNGYEN